MLLSRITSLESFYFTTGWLILTVISNHTLKTENKSLSLKTKLFFHSQNREFLIFIFQNIPLSWGNHPSLKTFELHNCESIKNTSKTDDLRNLFSFKYCLNESSDHYEIWNLSSLHSNWLMTNDLIFPISQRSRLSLWI